MTEDEKIKSIIKKYGKFFENTFSDVAQSQKGKWIFFEYDKEYNHYDSFYQFETAKELEQIIVAVLAENLNITMELNAENIQRKLDKIDINDIAENNFDYCIPKLQEYMKVFIIEYQKSGERLEVIFKSLSTVIDSL